MPKLVRLTPKYRKHRASGQAIVTIEGRDFYLGPHSTRASHREYDRIISEWLANGRRLPVEEDSGDQTLMVEVIAAYLRHCRSYYRKDGRVTSEVDSVRRSLKVVRQLYGDLPAEQFGPLKLRAVRQKMVDSGWCRTQINKHVQRVVRMFKWAASQELLPGRIPENLRTVGGLRKGRSDARESAPVLPVSDQAVDDAIEHLPPVVADMVRFQRLTGCRPGEVCHLRAGEVDRSGDVWQYEPGSHKTEHHGRRRVIYIGPRAQDVLRPYLLRPDDAYCFCPQESEKCRRQLASEARTTPLSCGNRPGTNRKVKPRQSAGRHYTPETYWQAISRACEKAGVDRWSPNQLRHTAATTIRKEFGLEAAQVILGHAAADVTQVYAERDAEKARDVIRRIG